jgi:hypothetical protein
LRHESGADIAGAAGDQDQAIRETPFPYSRRNAS